MEISYQSIKEKMEQYGYFAEDELIWQTYINIQNFINNSQIGQDIYAICLEGPPGSGKTRYAKITKMRSPETGFFFVTDVSIPLHI